MELIIYDTQSSRLRDDARRTLYVNAESGACYLSGSVVNLCGLKAGDRVILASSKDGKSWFLAKTDSDAGFPLHVKSSSHSLCFNSVAAARRISPSSATSCFLVSKDPQVIDGIEYYPIITSRSVFRECRLPPKEKE